MGLSPDEHPVKKCGHQYSGYLRGTLRTTMKIREIILNEPDTNIDRK